MYFEDYPVGKSCLFSKLSYTLRDLTYTNVTVLLALYILFREYHNPFGDHLADTGRKHRKGMDLMSSVRKGIPIKYQIIFIFGFSNKMMYSSRQCNNQIMYLGKHNYDDVHNFFGLVVLYCCFRF